MKKDVHRLSSLNDIAASSGYRTSTDILILGGDCKQLYTPLGLHGGVDARGIRGIREIREFQFLERVHVWSKAHFQLHNESIQSRLST